MKVASQFAENTFNMILVSPEHVCDILWGDWVKEHPLQALAGSELNEMG